MIAGKDYIGVGCGALILNEKSETLLMKRSKNAKNEAGYWCKPGGTVEFGETIEEAIIRETKEEIGVDIELVEYLGHVNHIIKNEGEHWISISYTARIIGGEPIINEPDKCDEIEWFTLNDLPEKLTQTTTEPIEVYLKMRRNNESISLQNLW